MATGRVRTHIRKIMVIGYEEPALSTNSLPKDGVCGAGDLLVVDVLHIVSRLSQQHLVRSREILVDLDLHEPVRCNGVRSSSPASSAP